MAFAGKIFFTGIAVLAIFAIIIFCGKYMLCTSRQIIWAMVK